MSIRFSVVTPCYNANPWIRACVASIADQEGVSVQHVVHDGGSTDGTAEYLLGDPRVQAESRRDKGMYDAINQAWAKCSGEFVVHINADEQLLPGALKTVGAYFQAHPKVDVALCGTLICNADGSLNCYRKPIVPTLGFLTTSHHPVPSCAIFLRRSSFTHRKWLYDPSFRLISDLLLMVDMLREGKTIATLDHYTSIFFLTGTNIGLTQSTSSRREYEYQRSLASPRHRTLRPAIRAAFKVSKLLKGHYHQAPLTYDIYLPGSEEPRKRFFAKKPSGVYRPEQTKDVR